MVLVQQPPAFAGGRHSSSAIDRACARCGYGVVTLRAPDRCPMCGGRVWRALPVRAPSAAQR